MSTQTMQQKIADYFRTQPVLKAWLFGSYARGEETEASDIDILIVPDRGVGLFKLSGMSLVLHKQDILQNTRRLSYRERSFALCPSQC